MLNMDKQTLQPHPSLLALRTALIAAEKGTPSRPVRVDPNERLALALIEGIRMKYRKTVEVQDELENRSDPIKLNQLIIEHA